MYFFWPQGDSCTRGDSCIPGERGKEECWSKEHDCIRRGKLPPENPEVNCFAESLLTVVPVAAIVWGSENSELGLCCSEQSWRSVGGWILLSVTHRGFCLFVLRCVNDWSRSEFQGNSYMKFYCLTPLCRIPETCLDISPHFLLVNSWLLASRTCLVPVGSASQLCPQSTLCWSHTWTCKTLTGLARLWNVLYSSQSWFLSSYIL